MPARMQADSISRTGLHLTVRQWAVVIIALLTSLRLQTSVAADFESRNFRVHAPTEDVARLVAAAAEHHRSRLGRIWYGHAIRNWITKCNVTVNVDDRVGASGSTKFKFASGEVYGWRMQVNGPLERILDSVVPHEVNHTILACWFRRKVPRWADEGCATMVEHESEQNRQTQHVESLMRQGRRIPLRMLLRITQYPNDNRQLMALYSQGYSLTRFLIEKAGRRQFLMFLKEANHRGWDRAIETYYGSRSIEGLEQQWVSWVVAGSPRLDLPDGELLAGTTEPGTPAPVVRAQNKEPQRTSFLEAPEPGLIAAVAASEPRPWQPATQMARVAQSRGHFAAPSTPGRLPAATPAGRRPLALTRIDRSRIRAVSDVRDPLRGSIGAEVPVPQPDLRAFDSPDELTQPILRETELRQSDVTPVRSGPMSWERFPETISTIRQN